MFVLGAIFLGLMVGATLTALVTSFWEEIREWLNNRAADVVQKYIGYDARKALQKAVCRADAIMGKIKNRDVVYYRPTPSSRVYDKVTLEMTAPTYEFDQEFLDYIKDQKDGIEQEMEYIE